MSRLSSLFSNLIHGHLLADLRSHLKLQSALNQFRTSSTTTLNFSLTSLMEKEGSLSSGDKQMKETPLVLEQTTSINEAELVELHDNRNGQFHRSFTPRQIHVRSPLAIFWSNGLTPADHLLGVQHRQWCLHWYRQSTCQWRPWKYGCSLRPCLQLRLGCASDLVRDDYCVPDIRQLYRLRRPMGRSSFGVWRWLC